jgi:subtilisin-like proprotein convertase family protein
LVTNLTAPLAKVMVSAHITHPKPQDLDLYLLAPDGTSIELSTDNGGAGQNYGQSCSDNQRTFFDDDGKYSISAQSAPFVSSFKPEAPLSVLRGRLLNGTWRLRVTDDTDGNAGTLNCWSLHLYPATCTGGGGPCAPCPDQTITGTITPTDPSTTGRLQLNHIASFCGSPKSCPGVVSDGGIRRCDLYPFLNGASNACVTVTLATTNALFTAIYTNWFAGGSDLCANYLADPGEPGSRSCSFDVAAGGAFVVVVSELSPGSSAAGGDYTLSVTGGSCLPRLDIEPAGGNRVVLTWPVFASDFRLERTAALNSVSNSFTPVTTVPFTQNREFTLTNTLTGTNRYYRLHKP